MKIAFHREGLYKGYLAVGKDLPDDRTALLQDLMALRFLDGVTFSVQGEHRLIGLAFSISNPLDFNLGMLITQIADAIGYRLDPDSPTEMASMTEVLPSYAARTQMSDTECDE